MAAARSPDRTVVCAHCGSVSVVEATYLGRVFNASPTGFPGSMPAPQEPAKISYAVFCLKKKNDRLAQNPLALQSRLFRRALSVLHRSAARLPFRPGSVVLSRVVNAR